MDKKYFETKIKGRYQESIAEKTGAALMLFCEQEPEFEQAIMQSGKSFQDCLDAVCKGGLGSSCDDLTVYAKAVKFYFPVAAVHYNMRIDLCGDNGAVDPPITQHKHDKPDAMQLSLDSLLDF